MSKRSNGNGSAGCGTFIIGLILIGVALFIYSYCWIPAIAAVIFFVVRKDALNRTRNIVISCLVLVSSAALFCYVRYTPPLEGIQADWGANEFDITDTPAVKIKPVPEKAEIDSITISDNDIADIRYDDGVAYITFKNAGIENLYFTADGKYNSSHKRITVVDKAAEEAAALKEIKDRIAAAQQAGQEGTDAGQTEQESADAGQDEQQGPDAGQDEQQGADAGQTEQETNDAGQAEPSGADTVQVQQEGSDAGQAQEQPQEQMVWIPQTGARYHSNPSCSGMNNPSQVTLSEAQNSGYTPCKKCY